MADRKPSKDVKSMPDKTNPSDSAEVDRMRAILEEARQSVKPIVKRELEGEIVSADLLNMRLKNADRA